MDSTGYESHMDSYCGKESSDQETTKIQSGCSSPQRKKLGSILKFAKQERTYDDLHPQILKNLGPKTKGFRHQKQPVGRNNYKSEELVKYMSNLPCYLEKGEKSQEKAFNIGVMDWRLLEQWQHSRGDITHINGTGSSYISPGGSSSFLNAPSTEACSSGTKSPTGGNGGKFQDRKTRSSGPETESSIKERKNKNPGLHKVPKVKSQHFETDGVLKGKAKEKLEVPSFISTRDSPLDHSCSKEIRSTTCPSDIKNMMSSPRSILTSPRRKNLDEKASVSTRGKLAEEKFAESTKVRNSSPNRRFIFGLGRTVKNSSSTVTCPVSENLKFPSLCDLTSEKSNAAGKARSSSPLKRLLDPLLRPKGGDTSHKLSSKSLEKSPSNTDKALKSDLKGTKQHERNGSSRKQALLQVAVKNGLPLFTFTVDNCSDILAATVKELNSRKNPMHRWVYTFFSFSEMKKKNAQYWINQGCKYRNHHGYVSNTVAQLKVSDLPKSSVREFVLSSMSTKDSDKASDALPSDDELAAMIVKFPENNESGSDDIFSVTVILPGGDHGVPRKGDPSPLIERWKSGGSCDCGGWDLGCRIRVLANGNYPNQRVSSAKYESATFKLFSQEEGEETKPMFILSPFEDGIFSIEFNSSLKHIQAFSIGIGILNSWTGGISVFEEITLFKSAMEKTSNQGRVEVSGEYVSYPPLSPFGRV